RRFLLLQQLSMAAKSRKQTGKSDKSEKSPPLASAGGKTGAKRAAAGRDAKTANGLSGIRHKLGLTHSAAAGLGFTLLLGKTASVASIWTPKPGLNVRMTNLYHLTQLFENDRHFSHLSTLEKEMAFRTEMGLYYSYYKTIIEAPSFLQGLHMVMNDRLTEYPLVINTLRRFNLYPEVVLASWYRVYTAVMGYFGVPTKMCWSINRGEFLTPVDSCEGLGDPAYFYVTCVFLLNGAMMSLFFLYGAYLSGSRLGGVVTTLCFFFNHGESTRVMWTPPLRESFAYPFLVLQMLLLTFILRYAFSVIRMALVALGISTLCFMLPWQFAQFVLLTQVASLFASYILGYLSAAKMQLLLVTHMVALVFCFVFMFGNAMLLTSFYASSLVSIWVIYSVLCSGCNKNLSFSLASVWMGSTVLLKFLLSTILGASDDAHISGLIKSKFTNYKDFHTLMYTCAAEFNFMEWETPERYLKTLLLPVTVLLVALIAKMVNDFMVTVSCALLQMAYHSLQLLAFSVLAVLIMRLKLFLTPHMCIMASLICSRQLMGWIKDRAKHRAAVFLVLALMAVKGVANLKAQWSIIGEFSNMPQEELLDWIQDNTLPDAVFAGAMPTMASVKLSTGRPIVNHPHYEDAGLRERTKLVYSMYSRMSAETVKSNLNKLGVDFFVLEDSWCTRRTGYDTAATVNSRPHFNTVFANHIYKVLKVAKDAR
uniref:Dpy-19-like 1, like (H. sapiens) n=1 Tax=Hippocampus comes TaxID=109280 RepID=A0A3Q2XK17_HIPCM